MIKTCCECKRTIQNNNYYYIDSLNKYLCSKKCLDFYVAKEKEKEDREWLYKTIERIWDISFPHGQMLAEIKRFKEKEGMSYSQISSVLHYIYDVQGKLPYGTSLYMVPLEKNKAKEWYLANKRREEEAKKLAAAPPPKARIIRPNTHKKKRGLLQDINPENV